MGILGSLGVLAIALGIAWLVNSIVLWILSKGLLSIPGATLGKCFLCSFGMSVACVISMLALFIPFIGIFVFFYAWYWISKMVIEGVFEMKEGGGTVFFLFLLINIGLKYGLPMIMGTT